MLHNPLEKNPFKPLKYIFLYCIGHQRYVNTTMAGIETFILQNGLSFYRSINYITKNPFHNKEVDVKMAYNSHIMIQDNNQLKQVIILHFYRIQ